MDTKDIIFDKEYTFAYRDKYNEQCQCEQCILFRKNFSKCYPEVVKFIKQFGIDVDYPLEIMEFGLDNKVLKRQYAVYYAVKGQLPNDKMTTTIGDVSAVMRNDKISTEAYSNTDLDKPFFIIELSNIFIGDIKAVFEDALNIGHEMEFHLGEFDYFLGRKKGEWQIYCEQTKETQAFATPNDLLNNAVLHDNKISAVWEEIIIDYLL